jgi:hypothetical protein
MGYAAWRAGTTLGRYTAKAQDRKLETNIPRNETARPRSRSYIHVICERFIYSHDRSAYLAEEKKLDRSWECINRSLISECGN